MRALENKINTYAEGSLDQLLSVTILLSEHTKGQIDVGTQNKIDKILLKSIVKEEVRKKIDII